MSATTPGLLAVLEAKPGKETALVEFLTTGLGIAAREAGVASWYAFRMTTTSFGIYDTFVDDSARHAHLSGPLVIALKEVANDLLARPPDIRELDVLVAKAR